ncbi:GNAT family N-acetyltransferase [Pedobacter jamesrossensis]|uniref:GNAT family N-acetyltransferase n=1 Tax=Pedobacter jamesrossensis TaxID=1908238 RepID=A0ABV8NKF7_9SPHI
MIIIKEVNFSYHKKEILELRKAVWEQNNPHPAKEDLITCFYDEYDEYAFHWAAFDEKNNIVASARLSKHNSLDSLSGHKLNDDADVANIDFPIASLSRLVIHKSFHGRGLCERLDKERIVKAEQLKCNSVCIITYGQRTKKIMDDGFEAFHSSILTNVFKTEIENKRFLPLAFYYKGITSIETI